MNRSFYLSLCAGLLISHALPIYADETNSPPSLSITKALKPEFNHEQWSLQSNKTALTQAILHPSQRSTQLISATGGGNGGNEKTGKFYYDGLRGDLPSLPILRDAKTNICYLENSDVVVYRYKKGMEHIISYPCDTTDASHNHVYWNGELNTINGGYSPDNDALFAGTMINAMYQEWFGIPALKNPDGSAMKIKIAVHNPINDNAFLDAYGIALGDGSSDSYPFTSPGIISFVVGLLFTEQHANLDGRHTQSGAMLYAFSSMADQAIKFYINKKPDWQIGGELNKNNDSALYYFDQPSKDCYHRQPGNQCSIDHMSQYKEYLEPHYASGIFRRAFYVLATTPGWDVKKAFSVMVKANQTYWTKDQNFEQGLCGVLKATVSYNYDIAAVRNAFAQVGLTADRCFEHK